MGEGPLEMVMKGLIMIDIIDLEMMGEGMV
jgi:hypothetical protein